MSLADALIGYAASNGRDITPVIHALAESRQRRQAAPIAPVEQPPGSAQSFSPSPSSEPTMPYKAGGAKFVLPAQWKPKHVPDGLGWNTRSAVDLFPVGPGTPVGAPEPGTVEYFHPTGAQGGGSMMYQGDSGREYWIGHIAGGAPSGSHLRRGQRIAVVADQNVSVPHVHIDKR